MARKKTTEEYKEQLKTKYPNLEILQEYINADTKILHRCRECGYERKIAPHILYQTKYGCPRCANEKRAKTQTRTHEEFVDLLKNINPNIEVLGSYQKSSKKILCRCVLDGFEWSASPNKLINSKTGCPLCAGNLKLTNEQFWERVQKIAPSITVLEPYVNDSTNLSVQCKTCGNKWKISPSHIYGERKCPECSRKNLHDLFVKPQDVFEKEMANINPNISIIGKYVNDRTKISCKCNVCDNTWSATPNNLLKKKGCPRCSASKGEKRIEKWLKKNRINYIPEAKFFNCKFKNCLPFDFYLPDFQRCIEFQGGQHFKPIQFGGNVTVEVAEDTYRQQKIRDKIKEDYCKSNGISLIKIPYWEYENIEIILEKTLIQ